MLILTKHEHGAISSSGGQTEDPFDWAMNPANIICTGMNCVAI